MTFLRRLWDWLNSAQREREQRRLRIADLEKRSQALDRQIRDAQRRFRGLPR